MEKLKILFVELVKTELSNYIRINENIVSNTIQHFAEMEPFNTESVEYWCRICSENGVKHSL